MNNRKLIVGVLLTAVGVAPAFVSATPAAAQDQTKEKQHKAGKGQTMTLDQLPQPVQQTINQEAQGGTVGKIKQETSRGKTFYEAEVSDQSGKKHHVRVNEDGSLMKGRSARANKESSSQSTTQSTTK
jgi:uncharacterized membrane protein YkoI